METPTASGEETETFRKTGGLTVIRVGSTNSHTSHLFFILKNRLQNIGLNGHFTSCSLATRVTLGLYEGP